LRPVADSACGGIEVLAPDCPDVDLEIAALGDDVGTRAARDDADVERDARPAADHSVDALDEVPRGEDRIAALLGLHARVGGPAVDGDLRVEDALPRRDDVAVRPRALQDEASVGGRGEVAGVGAAGQWDDSV